MQARRFFRVGPGMGAVDTLGMEYPFRRSVSGLAERQFVSASAKVHLPHIPIRLLPNHG